jgi:membrane protein YqaA with SNARE-associated domain
VLARSRGARDVPFFGFFLSSSGLFALGVLDATILFYLPLAIDTTVVLLAARNPDLFWMYPLVATAGSLVGAGLTYWMGQKAGETGLTRFVAVDTLTRLKRRVDENGAYVLAMPALFPPPFPYTPFVLTAGALEVDRPRFFATLAAARVTRFFAASVLALFYGRQIVAWMKSETFRYAVGALAAVAIVGTAVTIYRIARGRRT